MTFAKKNSAISGNSICFILLLFSSLLVHIKVSFLTYAVYDYLLPLSAIALLVINSGKIADAVKLHRKALLFLLLLYTWTWISALNSAFPDTSIKYSIKYTIYLIVFFSFLIITYKSQGNDLYLKIVQRFLLFLAIFGMVEYFFPHLQIFHIMRSPASLMVKPRISSLMQWPNQLGVLMSLGIVLSLISYKKKTISSIEFYAGIFLFVFTLSLASSRNGWLVFLLGIFLLWLYRTVTLKNAILIIGFLSFFILFFPPSTTQLGIKGSYFFPIQEKISQIITGPRFLTNGGFEKGHTAGWEPWVNPTTSAQASFHVTSESPYDGSYNGLVIVDSTGPSQPDIQIKQGNFSLIKGEEYIVSFAAKATEPKLFRVVAIKNAPNWRTYGLDKEVTLSTQWEVYTFSFTATADANDASLNFYFGSDTADVEIDSVQLIYKSDDLSMKTDGTSMDSYKNSADSQSFFEKATTTMSLKRRMLATGSKSSSYYGVTPTQTMHSRSKLWETAKKHFFNNPLTGVGIQSFNSLVGNDIVQDATGKTHNSHNIFINILVELGIPGLILACAFVYLLVKRTALSNSLAITPIILLFSGQIFDFFLYDFTYTIITLYFLAAAGNSISHENS